MNLEAAIRMFAAMITAWDWLLIFLVWLGLHTAKQRFPEPFVKPRWGWRMLPFTPSGVCIVCCFVPGPWIPVDAVFGMRVLFGALLGVAAYNFGGIAKVAHLDSLLNAAGIDMIVAKTGGKPKDRP